MKRIIAIFLVVAFGICGCNVSSELQPLETLRNTLKQGTGCEFDVVISAFYDRAVYTFGLRCSVGTDGAMTFVVLSPESISGIAGSIDQGGAKLIYDDMLLAVPYLADGELSPVFAPWLMCAALTDGLFRVVSKEPSGCIFVFDDIFRGESLQIDVMISEAGVPISSEIFWQQKRIIQMSFSNFRFL